MFNQFCNCFYLQDVETEPLDFTDSHNEYDDEVMVNVIKRQGHWLTKVC